MDNCLYDLFSLQFKQNPFPTFAQMRGHDPVYKQLSPNGVTTWYVTGYEDVLAVLKDNDRFVKDARQARPQAKRPSSSQQPSIQQLINQNMLFSDPPDHTRLRALVNQAFTPRRIEQMDGRIQAITNHLLDKAAVAGQMNLIADFALPLPVIVICELLGIPAADQEDVTDYSQAIISPRSRGLSSRERKQKMRALVAYLQQMFADRQQQPQDDLVTALVQAEMAGDKLNEAELSSMVALLLVTGHETTVNLIGNGVVALLHRPQQLQLLLADGGLWEMAVEELLRYDGPVETSTTRWVRRDCEFRGQQMKQGDIMRVVLASANRDGRCFAAADKLDINRADVRKHLAFGHGIHYCLGAPLARLEGRIALRTLFTRFPTLQLAAPTAELKWRSGVLFRGLESLPLNW
ncbi:MAG: cytochrome P450 [Chloroflexi bacterium]|nr:cytochrome P450 [Chloroflexota bacterium]